MDGQKRGDDEGTGKRHWDGSAIGHIQSKTQGCTERRDDALLSVCWEYVFCPGTTTWREITRERVDETIKFGMDQHPCAKTYHRTMK